ncbi:MAG TPA: O-antigen ligase family protein [Bryobacteraceae bacterium]
MALVLTLLSLILAYFSPEELVPSLAPYHVQQIVILPAIAASLISMNMRRAALPMPQAVLMIGFWIAAVLSDLTKLWTRAALSVFLTIGLLVCIYFLVYLNAFTLSRIQLFCAILSVCALIMAVRGILAYHTGYMEDKLLNVRLEGLVLNKRICGVGVLHDPNDLAQFLLVGLTFLGLFWKKDNAVGSFILLFVPSAVLIYAIYLTFSRGAVFGVVVVLFVAVSRRIGKLPSALAAGLLFAFMLAMKFGGGREISMQEGSAAGRIVAWGAGLAQLRHFPVFGAGFQQFTEYNDLTAHNSFVLCFAELGMLGYFFWLALILTTIWGLENLTKIMPKRPADFEFARYVTTIRAALYGFLATAWFLSRTYTETLYIILALGAVLIYMRRDIYSWLTIPARRWVPVTLALQLSSVVLIYVLVRLRSF